MDLPRKAISIRQPWAWAIVHAGKDIENRDWSTRYRGPVCIHAAKGMTKDEFYIKGEGGFDAPYFGKILGTTFQPTREGHAAGETLTLIAKDPLEAALRYGRRTGNCACCGRLLTNHTSIDAGIGPICKAKWGL